MLSSDNIKKVGEFHFEWNLFSCLGGLSENENDLSRFNPLTDHFGVYIFFDEKKVVSYIGLCGKKSDQKQDMRTRIGQYFKHKHDSGNVFAREWMGKNQKKYKDFKLYIAKCQLGTLSTCGKIPEADRCKLTGNTGVLGDMERFLIYALTPVYNSPVYRLTNDEENCLGCFVKAKNPNRRDKIQVR